MKKVSVILAVIILVFCGSGYALFRSDTSSAQNPSVTVTPADSTPAPAESHDAAAASEPTAAPEDIISRDVKKALLELRKIGALDE